jgi:hypothetical protein
VKRTITRGVTVFRQTNSISFAGHGMGHGIYVNFGKEGRIAELELVSRNLEEESQRPTASARQLVQRVEGGKTVIQLDNERLAITRLTITNAVPHYFSQDGLTIQKRVLPFVELQTHAETPNTNFPLIVICPLLR